MDEAEHHRAEVEMKALHLRHLHQRNETQQFVKRVTSMLYKALLLAIALGFLCLLPSHFTVFARYSPPAVLARSWDAISILLVSFVICFGFLGRTQPDVQEIDRRENVFYVNTLFESNGNFGDSAVKPVGSNYSALASNGCEYSPQKSDGFEAVSDSGHQSSQKSDGFEAVSDFGYQSSQKSDGFEAVLDSGYQSSQKSEVNYADSLFSTVVAEVTDVLENEHNFTVDGRRLLLPPPQPAVSINPEPQKDSNMAPPIMRYRSLKRKRKIVSHSLPHPPRASPGLETLFPKHRSKDAHAHENSEKAPKIDIKSDNKNPSNLPPYRPHRSNEDGFAVNHESRHRRSRNKEDSQHRTKEDEHKHRSSKDEHKHRSSKEDHKYNSAEDFVNALGPLDRKHKKIPYQPTPPLLSSTLEQWWSSYKKEPKHKSKDSEPSPRVHSNKSSRNVHSSSFPNPAPPPPIPPASIVNRISKHHRKVHSSTSHPPRPPLPPTSMVERISKHHRKVHSSTSPAPAPPSPTLIVERVSKHHRNGGYSENNGLSKSRRDATFESKDSFNSSQENMLGDDKAEKKLASMQSSPIHLPPPPPPPFPMFQHQRPLSDGTKRGKRRRSTAESVKSESEPDSEPEHGWTFAFRKQFSLDNVNPQFCPSPGPDEVNRKADAFIARFREQIRLQK